MKLKLKKQILGKLKNPFILIWIEEEYETKTIIKVN